jgi:hypothetical protein
MSQGRRVSPKTVLDALVAAALWLTTPAPTQAQTGATDNNLQIAYLHPDNHALRPIYTWLMERQTLERMRDALSFIKLPRPLLLRFAQCNDDNAWYDYAQHNVTFCYELVAHIQKIAPKKMQEGVHPQDAVAGAVVFSFLHEVGHAVFDMLTIPILGREEDAADQFAAHAILFVDKSDAKRLIGGAAWMWAQDAKANKPGRGDLADVHSLSSQRFFNLLCMAYGADADMFGFVVEKGYLPRDRAVGCKREYDRFALSARQVFQGDIDREKLERIRLQFAKTKDPSRKR